MKTKNLLIGLALMANSSLFAQPWQSLIGNSPAPGSGAYIGTLTAEPMRIRTLQFQPILFQTNGLNNKMLLSGSVNGFAAFGNNLPTAFVPLDRLHLHHTTASNVRTRFTHIGVTNGSTIGIDATGNYCFTQFEAGNTDFLTPRNVASSPAQVSRFEIAPNGQMFVGSIFDAENQIYNATLGVDTAYSSYSQVPTSLLNVRGPINSCADLRQNLRDTMLTILYGYTTPSGNPTWPANDGFRMKKNLNFRGRYLDALVFEKTDGGQLDPDGYIAFTNTGIDNNEEISLYIDGKGRTNIGKRIDTLKTRLTIDSEWNATSNADAAKSGLRFYDLRSNDTAKVNPGPGVLAVDSLGNVIYVQAGSGGGGGGADGADGLACWDLNGDGVKDSIEDIDGNNIWDAMDCQGATGPAGPAGPSGATGPQGPPGMGIAEAENGASINASGKVVLGQRLNAAGNPGQLFAEVPGAVFREVPMNGLSLLFTNRGNNNALTNSKVGIGTTNTPQGKLEIKVDNTDNASTALFIDQSYPSTGSSNGIFMRVNGQDTLTNYGERSFVSNAHRSNVNKELVATGGTLSQGISVRSEDGTNQSKGISVFAGRNIIGTFSTGRNVAYEGEAFDSQIENFGAFITGGRAGGNATGSTSKGIFTQARGAGNQSYAIDAYASGGTLRSYGIQSIVNAADGSGQFFHGLNSTAEGGLTENAGVYATTGTTATNNYAIYARAIQTGFTNTRFAGYFDGNLHVTGQVTSTNGTIIPSDQQFKTNVEDLSGALAILNQLQPKTYFYDTVNYTVLGFEKDQQMGLIAQEVEQVLPTLVSQHRQPAQYDSLGVQTSAAFSYKGIEYQELIPLLVSGINEQQQQIASKDSLINDLSNDVNELQAQMIQMMAEFNQLKACLNNAMPNLCEATQSAIETNDPAIQDKIKAAIEVKLTDKGIVILSQNVPNPFAESTVINYNIPGTVQHAQIQFYNNLGQLINSVDLTERGSGEVKVFAQDLSSGIYTYSLVADGKVITTKKMIKK